MNALEPFNVLEPFAGVGGMSLGLERAGMTVVGQVEIDPYCLSVLARHWPEVPRHDDVHTAPYWWFSEDRPPVHLIAGGFPCQPVSVAGKALAQRDARWLWPAMLTLIAAVRPGWVLIENVLGLRTRGLDIVRGDLRRLGYRSRAGVIRACEVGAPHPRPRLFVVAHADGVHGSQGLGRHQHPGGSVQRVDGGAADWVDPVERAVEAQRRPDGVADGLAARMVAAGGNAVVPAVAERLGQLILAA